ncbi:amidase [Pusillimonas sp. SM2304]|uniref:amidase n=1 Tax=Pusillimonas sp. SM2304 TaxID=3073241 RepID=UPI002875B143|nr:amidase [Pusillimonas sp. SM2304]MDS1139381.1 amidase [Pusillimonas sp. SM2304]
MACLNKLEPDSILPERRLRELGIELDSVTSRQAGKAAQRLARFFQPASDAAKASSQTAPATSLRAAPPTATGSSPAHARPFIKPLPSNELPSSIAGLRAWIRQGRLSVHESLDIQRRSFEAADIRIHSVVRFCQETVPVNANGSLAGVGLAHKDNIACGEFAPGNGQAEGERPADVPAMAPVIRTLQASGATQMAALAMAERACGATSENHHFPDVVNPLNEAWFVGGSSSGSAAAVAAGFCYGALGTDTAGSVRIPAASCGVLGLKPSRGLLSGEGVLPLAPSLDTVGLIARSAADLHTLYLAAAGKTPATIDQTQTPARIANALDLSTMHPHVAEVLASFLSRQAPAQAWQQTPLEFPREAAAFGETLFYYEAARHHMAGLRASAGSMNTAARQLCAQGLLLPQAWYAHALSERPRLSKAFTDRYFSNADILICPAFSIPVPDRGQVSFASPDFDPAVLLEMYRWMMPANFLDLPALVMPVGADQEGRPVSVQILGRPGTESLILDFARKFEVENCGRMGQPDPDAPPMQTTYVY